MRVLAVVALLLACTGRPPRPAAVPSPVVQPHAGGGAALLAELDQVEERLLAGHARVEWWRAKSCRGWACP